MRDGEKFFAKGQDNAKYELVQQQMKRAGTWRLGMRRQVLRELALLGRRPHQFRVEQGRVYRSKDVLRRSESEAFNGNRPGMAGGGGGFGGAWDVSVTNELLLSDSMADAEMPASLAAGDRVQSDKKSYFGADQPEEAAALRGDNTDSDRLASIDEATPAGGEAGEEFMELEQKRELAGKPMGELDFENYAYNGRFAASGPHVGARTDGSPSQCGPLAELPNLSASASGTWGQKCRRAGADGTRRTGTRAV